MGGVGCGTVGKRIVIASRIPPRHFEASRLRGFVDCMYWIENVKNEHDRSGRKKETVQDECKEESKHGSGQLGKKERRNEERHGRKRERRKEGMNGGHTELGGRREGGEGF